MMDKPQYHQQGYESPAKLSAASSLGANGTGESGPVARPLIHGIDEPIQDADNLGEYISKACSMAAARVVEEHTAKMGQLATAQIAAMNQAIENLKTVGLQYVSKIETMAKLREELALRESSLQVTLANQMIAVRILVMIALVTACAIWGFSVFSPALDRTIAATIFSLVTVGPLVALLWKKG